MSSGRKRGLRRQFLWMRIFSGRFGRQNQTGDVGGRLELRLDDDEAAQRGGCDSNASQAKGFRVGFAGFDPSLFDFAVEPQFSDSRDNEKHHKDPRHHCRHDRQHLDKRGTRTERVATEFGGHIFQQFTSDILHTVIARSVSSIGFRALSTHTAGDYIDKVRCGFTCDGFNRKGGT